MLKNFAKLNKPLALALAACLASAAVAEELPAYRQVPGVAGNVSSIGSDTLNNLMTYWAEAFRAIYPNVRIQIEGKGSGTAPPALTEGTAQLGPMSRAMTPAEEEAFEKKHGFKPLAVSVAIDCVAVYVNKDNPLPGLTLAQADAIFSSTRKREEPDMERWGQAGLAGEWTGRPISIYGRNSASGTYAFFKEHVMQRGDFKNTVKEQPGSAAVVNGVAGDMGGIGYSGIGYKTSEVRALPLSPKAGEAFVEPAFVNAIDGSYPLGRVLYIYIPKYPGQPLPAAVAEFIRFILSREGQAIVVKDGYGELPIDMLKEQLQELEK